MTKAVIQDVTYWLNAFPSDNGLSHTLILHETLQGLPNPNYDKIDIYSGSYDPVHRDTNNTKNSRIIGAISLRSDTE